MVELTNKDITNLITMNNTLKNSCSTYYIINGVAIAKTDDKSALIRCNFNGSKLINTINMIFSDKIHKINSSQLGLLLKAFKDNKMKDMVIDTSKNVYRYGSLTATSEQKKQVELVAITKEGGGFNQAINAIEPNYKRYKNINEYFNRVKELNIIGTEDITYDIQNMLKDKNIFIKYINDDKNILRLSKTMIKVRITEKSDFTATLINYNFTKSDIIDFANIVINKDGIETEHLYKYITY